MNPLAEAQGALVLGLTSLRRTDVDKERAAIEARRPFRAAYIDELNSAPAQSVPGSANWQRGALPGKGTSHCGAVIRRSSTCRRAWTTAAHACHGGRTPGVRKPGLRLKSNSRLCPNVFVHAIACAFCVNIRWINDLAEKIRPTVGGPALCFRDWCSATSRRGGSRPRRLLRPPVVVDLGHVRKVTLGSSSSGTADANSHYYW
ncbi:lasso RiPP family leader peptide-containing protein [Streptomyces flavidovirens]|uniref:lasso RiPP family leader peptide-containing protein n=1 Tax=Streptomyces flavidovirens TaxID=67298 RepID=UPI0034447A19